MRRIFAAAGSAAWTHILPPATLDALALNEDLLDDLDSLLVAEDHDLVVGFAKVARESCELALLYTVPEAWGRGAGRALMDVALERLRAAGCERAFLWTEKRNGRPRRVYEEYGWRLTGETREYAYRGTPLLELRYAIELVPPSA